MISDFNHLSAVLSVEELANVSIDLKTKLETHLEIVGQNKRQSAQTVANIENKCLSAERQLQNSLFRLQASEEFAEKLKNQLRETEEALHKSRNEYFEAFDCKQSLSLELNLTKEKSDRFAAEKNDLNKVLERRQEEIQELQNELQTLCSRFQSESEGKVETLTKTGELELKMLSLEHKEKRLAQEKQLYEQQIQTLNEELTDKVNELLAIRRERALQMFEMQTTLDQKSDENSKYLDEIRVLKQMIEKKDKHIEGLAVRMGEIQHSSAQLEEDFHNEITAQKSLIESQKETINELKKRNQTLIQTIEEMQKMLQTAKTAHSDLENTFNDTQSRLTQQLTEVLTERSFLRQELEEIKKNLAKNMELAFERQYPLAANAKKLLDRSTSLTQIFSDMGSAQKALEDERRENAVLKEYLSQVANESNENEPLLQRKIQEHQRACQTVADLRTQLSAVLVEKDHWLREKDAIIRVSKQFEREIERYERENKDLSRQIRALIRSVQEARGFSVCLTQDSNVSSSDSRDIPPELVTFKDIEELQTKNRELMNALRESNEKMEKVMKENGFVLQKELEEALQQLEQLRHERQEQVAMVDALIHQRHTQATPDTKDQRSPGPTSVCSPYSLNRNNGDEYNELKINFNKLTKEYENYRQENTLKLKELNESYDRVREELSSFKVDSAKMASELTFTIERMEMFKTNCEQFQKENVFLKEKNTILNENVKKHEQTSVLLRNDVLAANERANRVEKTVESLKCERDLYRNNETKLVQEKEFLLKSSENQNKLINTLQTLQNSWKQMESESINSLKVQNNKLESERQYWRNKFDKEVEQHLQAIRVWEKSFQEVRNKLDEEIDKHLETHKEMSEYQKKSKNFEIELNQLKESVNQAMNVQTSATNEAQANRALQSQLVVQREQFLSQIANANQNLEKVTQELEKTKKLRQNGENLMQNLRQEVELKNNEVKKLTEESIQLRTENQNIQITMNQLRKVGRKYKQQYDELKIQFDQLQTECQQLKVNQTISTTISEPMDTQINELTQKNETLMSEIQENEKQIQKLNTDLAQVIDERDVAKGQAQEKEERAKKIAFQAKQRLSAISSEKNMISKEKEILEKSVEELSAKVKQFEQNCEENDLRMATMKSQFEAKARRTERELTEALKQMEELKNKHQNQPTIASNVQTVQSTSVHTAAQTTNPVRHQVLPQAATVQPLSVKSTPMASIRPLAVAPTLRNGRNPRTATVATVQPTTEDQNLHQSVPQATVHPTQAFNTPLVSTQEPEVIVSQTEEQVIEEAVVTSQDNEPIVETINVEEEQQREEPLPPPPSTSSSSSSSSRAIVANIRSEPTLSEPTTSKVSIKRTRVTFDETLNTKKAKTETEESIESEEIQSKKVEEEEDDDVIILESDSEEEPKEDVNECEDNIDDEEADDEEEDDEEEDEEYDEENEENEENEDENQDKSFPEENEEYVVDEEESHYEDQPIEEHSEAGSENENLEDVGVSDDVPEGEVNEDVEQQPQQTVVSETMSSSETEPTVDSTSVPSVVTTESNPFIQIPTPIQRPFGSTNRQSFFLNQTQQNAYDEGDGIVPSTPTLFVPRRGDGFIDSLNSPRVPQARFVFSSNIPESVPVSQLATETTLGVDDTRMDLSQFDDNNGRSLPLTNSGETSGTRSLDIEVDSDHNFAIDSNLTETVIPTETESDSSVLEIEKSAEDLNESENSQKSEESQQIGGNQTLNQSMPSTSSSSISSVQPSSSAQRGHPMARRGGVIGLQRGGLLRRPIMAPKTPQFPSDVPQNRPLLPTPGSQDFQQQPQQQQQQPQQQRNQRLNKFGGRGNFRGRPSRGTGRGGRGSGFHYNN